MAREALKADPVRGDRLRKLREEVEYADLASAAEGARVSVGGLRKWESGGEIERKSIAALARFYGASPKWIVEGKGPMLRPDRDLLDRLSNLELRVKAHQALLERLADEMEIRDVDPVRQLLDDDGLASVLGEPRRGDKHPPNRN